MGPGCAPNRLGTRTRVHRLILNTIDSIGVSSTSTYLRGYVYQLT